MRLVLALLCVVGLAADQGVLRLRQIAPSGAACAHCFFETSFTTTEGWASDIGHSFCGGGGFGSIQPGVSERGAFDSANNNCTGIATAANYANGRGGRGIRQYFSNGQNNYSPGVVFTFSNMTGWPGGPARTTEFWVRWYTRYEDGFTLAASGGSHKLLYADLSLCDVAAGGCYMNFDGLNGLRMVRNGNIYGSNSGAYGFTSMNGGSNNGDGTFHCLEAHWKGNSSQSAADGEFHFWIDSTLRANSTVVVFQNFSDGGFAGFTLPHNADLAIAGGVDKTVYTDDIAVSLTQRVGCF